MNNKQLHALIIFIISFVIYILTLNPDVTFTDSGELAGVLSTLGVAHPTGYPLFTMLGHLWLQIPMPFTNIYQVNLLAAFFTACGIATFYFLINIILQNIKTKLSESDTNIIAIASSLLLAFASVIWMQANAVEVYSLHLFLINLVLYFATKAYFSNAYKDYLIAGLFLGLSFANHLTTVLLVPALMFIFFLDKGKFNFSKDRFKLFLILLIPILLAMSLYLYLPIRSSSGAMFNWGEVSRSWDKFYYHFSGKQYQVWMFSGKEAWKANFVEFMSLIPYQLAFAGILFYLVGVFYLFKKNFHLSIFLNLLLLTCIFYSFNYSIHDIENYFILAYLVMVIFTGVGILIIAEKHNINKYIFLVLPLIAVSINYSSNDQSKNYAVSEYTRIMSESLEENAIVISAQWDFYCSAFWYKQAVEGYRKDVFLVEKEILRRTWYPTQLKKWYPELGDSLENEINLYMEQLTLFEEGKAYDNVQIQARFINLLNAIVDKFYDKRPIYITYDIMQTEKDFATNYQKVPSGLAFRLLKNDSLISPNFAKLNFDKFISSLDGRTDKLSKGIKETSAMAMVNLGRFMQYKGDPNFRTPFQLALKIEPENPYAIEALGR